MAKIYREERLYSVEDVKKILLSTGGIFDINSNWVSIESGKIAGVVEFNSKQKTCSIVFNCEQSILYPLAITNDNELHMLAFEALEFRGPLTKENVALYNLAACFEYEIVKFVNIDLDSIKGKIIDDIKR